MGRQRGYDASEERKEQLSRSLEQLSFDQIAVWW
jgi:hypothetical protein